MKKFFRRLRGALGTAATWALGWGATGTAIFTAAWIFGGDDLGAIFREVIPYVAATAAVTGAIAGVTFSGLLSALYSGRKLEELSPGRTAVWGGAAGVLIPGAIIGVMSLLGPIPELDVIAITLGSLGVAGALTAGGTLKVAQIAAGVAKREALLDGAPSTASAAPPAAAPAPKTPKKVAPPPPEDDDMDAALAEALKDDPEIARLLGDDP